MVACVLSTRCLKSMWREDSSGTKEVVNLVTSPVLLGSLPIAHAVGLPMSTFSEDSKKVEEKEHRGRLTTPTNILILSPVSFDYQ